MKVCLVSRSDLEGGAFIAAYRLHRALRYASVDSTMLVSRKCSDDPYVIGPETKVGKAKALILQQVNKALIRFQKTMNTDVHSLNLFPSSLLSRINASGAAVVNLHWVNGEAISIGQISRINKPVVFTLHDMWAFSGAEHFTNDTESARFRTGYHRDNRPSGHASLDLDRWVWQRKLRRWGSVRHVVCVSRWLASCARDSFLMRGWPVHVIPNVLDLYRLCPLNKSFCRQALGLPPNVPLIGFGALSGTTNGRKGFDLLISALGVLANDVCSQGAECIVFGQSEPLNPPRLGLPLRFMGHLHDEYSLALLYSAVDVIVVPSRQESFGQTGSEAQACGCPVVAFNATGLQDVVQHGVTGYLAEPYEPEDLAKGIKCVLEDSTRRQDMAAKARERAEQLWSPEVVVSQYLDVYKAAMST